MAHIASCLQELLPFFRKFNIFSNFMKAGASVSHGHISSYNSKIFIMVRIFTKYVSVYRELNSLQEEFSLISNYLGANLSLLRGFATLTPGMV